MAIKDEVSVTPQIPAIPQEKLSNGELVVEVQPLNDIDPREERAFVPLSPPPSTLDRI